MTTPHRIASTVCYRGVYRQGRGLSCRDVVLSITLQAVNALLCNGNEYTWDVWEAEAQGGEITRSLICIKDADGNNVHYFLPDRMPMVRLERTATPNGTKPSKMNGVHPLPS